MANRMQSWRNSLNDWWDWNYWLSERTWRDKLRWYLQRFLGFWRPGVRQLGLLSFIIGVLGVRPISWGLPYDPVWTEFYHTIVPELLAIGVTVLLVDYANERRADRELKAQLIRQMGSKHPEVAATALEELRAHNWLYDGSLQGANLWGANLPYANLRRANLQGTWLEGANLQGAGLVRANLRDAQLERANLQGAQLERANLQGAVLVGANLQGAQLERANLQGAYLREANLQASIYLDPKQVMEARDLRGAIMPNGDCYMGEFDLEGDVRLVQWIGVDVNDPEALARWYKEQCDVARRRHRAQGWLRDDD